MYEDKEYNFNHKCSTKDGSSGSPILNIKNEIIGIHKGGTTKYNVGTFLNYPIEEFIEKYNEELLKDFKNKYKLIIKDSKINKLDLYWKHSGNEGLKDLNKIEFKELKKLYLYDDIIFDIKVLEKFKFNKLEILGLLFNQISEKEKATINSKMKSKIKKLDI